MVVFRGVVVYSVLRVVGVVRCPEPHPRRTVSTVSWIKSRVACVKDLGQRGVYSEEVTCYVT